MSSILLKFEDAKKALEEFSRKRKFKKANKARAEAAELQSALATCRGKLEICKKDFNRTIKSQSAGITEGLALGADTTIQEQMLWDAAIGYMMVKDAIYSMKTIATFDSVTHAYDMLSTAVDLITERQRLLPRLPKLGGNRSRNVYGYITSNTALKQKQELLDGFFEELKKTGDIETCLANAKNPADVHAARSLGSFDSSNPSLWDEVLGKGNASTEEDISADALGSMMDIHPPV